MATHIQFIMNNNSGKRRLFHSLLAILTGVLVLLWPDSLYYILGSYLIATGLVFLFFRTPSLIVAASVVTGVFIFAFPSFIPYFFAFFLLVIGIGSLLSGGLTGFAVFPLLAAVLLIMFPDIISIIVAAFLLLYGVTSIVSMIRSRNKDKEIIEVY
ncbi:DUF3096 domain-containing protein [Balneolales bacterium ANBcel1]|nr:DUF3096 domain-containing protein [Balneolales bacterium ANBcel1]